MAIQLKTFKKMIDELVKKGHGHKLVHVNKKSFTDPCEADGAVILPVGYIEIRHVNKGDPDGGIKENENGSEAYSTLCVIKGEE